MQTIQEFGMDGIEDVVEVPLTRGQVALIDREDWDRVQGYNWIADYNKCTRSYYAVTKQNIQGKRRKIKMHRLIMDAQKEMQVDHINRNTLDNRKKNLRLCYQHQNKCNSGKRKTNTSGFKGVYKNRHRWRAQIQFCGKLHYLGTFDTREAAHAAYCEAALRLHGEFANFGNDEHNEVQHVPDSRSASEILWDARKRIDNTSGFRGVSKKRRLWMAKIWFLGKGYPLGTSETPEQASQIYEQAAAIRRSLGPEASHAEFEAAIAPLRGLRRPARSGHGRKDAEREQVPCEV